MMFNSSVNLYPILWFIFFVSVSTSPVLPRNSTQQWTFAEIPPSKELIWYPCNLDFYCAMLEVPLDYTRPSEGVAYVPVIKYSATTTPYKGMILTNPGGPGGSGVSFLLNSVQVGLKIGGSNYDLVSWDPRGVNNSIPVADCKLSPDLTGRKLKIRSQEKLYGPSLAPVYFEEQYASAQEIGPECWASIGGPKDAGPHMTTATVARDMVSILDAFQASEDGQKCGDSGLLNYWGISYGTVIGQTFASMFPERVGRVVLDGVVDPDAYIANSARNSLTYTDDTFATFFLYCNLAGPTLCPFYTGTTQHDIFLRFEAIVTKLNATQAFKKGWSNATAIEELLTGIKSILFDLSYSPIASFPLFGQILPVVESILPNLNLAKIETLEKDIGLNVTNAVVPEELWDVAIRCSDGGNVDYGKSLDDFTSTILEAEKESFLAGEVRTAGSLDCTAWNISSDDRFAGPFVGRTKNPILFVSNTLDPVTPIQNGRKGASSFYGAELLTIEGTGHSSINSQNKCGWAKMNTYFQSGALPGEDNYCSLEAGPFNITITGPLEKRDDLAQVQNNFRLMRRQS